MALFTWVGVCWLSIHAFQVSTTASFYEKIYDNDNESSKQQNGPIIKREFFQCNLRDSCSNVVKFENGNYQLLSDHRELKTLTGILSVWKKISTPKTAKQATKSPEKKKPVCSSAVGPLGMQSRSIPDNRITASSNQMDAPTSKARLGTISGSWTAAGFGYNEYLQVDFAKTMLVHAVATQGSPRFQSWVRNYEISFSTDGVTFTTIMNESQTVLRFNGNYNQNTVVKNIFPSPVVARYIRINAMQHKSAKALRAEFYGCDLKG